MLKLVDAIITKAGADRFLEPELEGTFVSAVISDKSLKWGVADHIFCRGKTFITISYYGLDSIIKLIVDDEVLETRQQLIDNGFLSAA